jgi:hypothetical protein
MKRRDVQLGAIYLVKVSGKLTRVRLTRESPYGGWEGVNLATHREVHIRSAARLRAPLGQYRPTGINTTTPQRAPAERGITLDMVRAWRLNRLDRNEPNSLGDFFRDLGLCPDCKGRGQLQATQECLACGGTGLVRCRPTL